MAVVCGSRAHLEKDSIAKVGIIGEVDVKLLPYTLKEV